MEHLLDLSFFFFYFSQQRAFCEDFPAGSFLTRPIISPKTVRPSSEVDHSFSFLRHQHHHLFFSVPLAVSPQSWRAKKSHRWSELKVLTEFLTHDGRKSSFVGRLRTLLPPREFIMGKGDGSLSLRYRHDWKRRCTFLPRLKRSIGKLPKRKTSLSSLTDEDGEWERCDRARLGLNAQRWKVKFPRDPGFTQQRL